MAEQSFATHRKFVPLYHFVTTPIVTVNLIWSLYRLVNPLPGVPLFDRVLAVAMAVAIGLIFFFARIFPLRAQDRVIRLEETLRMERLLPPDLRARIPELRAGQIVALRFASDEELPELARAVLDGQVRTSDEIKQRVRRWRADHFRL
jgi:uncharacterized membrane protein YraQ (UPF0718 family)